MFSLYDHVGRCNEALSIYGRGNFSALTVLLYSNRPYLRDCRLVLFQFEGRSKR